MSVGSRLRLVRESEGLSQKAFANLFGLNQALFSKYETGALEAPEAFVSQVAEKYGFLPSFFSSPEVDVASGLIFHRKRASLSARERMKVEAEGILRADDIAVAARKLRIKSDFPPAGITYVWAECNVASSPAEAAAWLRDIWDVPQGPIEDVCALFEKHGVFVLKYDFGTREIDAFLLPVGADIVCIALNSEFDNSPDRQRHSLCHELGHALLHRESFPGKECEMEADAFAAAFLAPEEDFRRDINRQMTFTMLKGVKAKWKISMSSIVLRANRMGVMGDSTYRRTLIWLSSIGCRKQEPLCGIVPEKPHAATATIKRYIGNDIQAIDDFGLSREKFFARYPELAEKEAAV